MHQLLRDVVEAEGGVGALGQELGGNGRHDHGRLFVGLPQHQRRRVGLVQPCDDALPFGTHEHAERPVVAAAVDAQDEGIEEGGVEESVAGVSVVVVHQQRLLVRHARPDPVLEGEVGRALVGGQRQHAEGGGGVPGVGPHQRCQPLPPAVEARAPAPAPGPQALAAPENMPQLQVHLQTRPCGSAATARDNGPRDSGLPRWRRSRQAGLVRSAGVSVPEGWMDFHLGPRTL